MTADDMARLHAAVFTMPRPWTVAEISAAMADPFGLTLTESKGFLLGRVVAGEAEILTLVVDPTARRQGIGASLVSRFVDQAKAKGAESVFLEVADSNLEACALYQKQGFLPRGRRKGYYRDSTGRAIDAVVMVWGK